MKIRTAGTFLVFFALLTPLFAAMPQTDWATVQAIAPGTKVRIDTKGGRSYTGNVSRITDSDIMFAPNSGAPQTIGRTEVKRIYRLEPGGGSRGKSIGIWAAIGAGVGAAIGAAVLGATGGSDETGKVIAPFILGGAGAGAAIGAALGKGEKKRLIYEAK